MILAWEEENKIVFLAKEGQPMKSCLVFDDFQPGIMELKFEISPFLS
jgi:hypothetical protein